jgi:hypothetical protein
VNQPLVYSTAYSLRTTGGSEAFENRSEVMLHGSLSNVQLPREMLVRFSRGDADKNFGLSRRQHTRVGFCRREPSFAFEQPRNDLTVSPSEAVE